MASPLKVDGHKEPLSVKDPLFLPLATTYYCPDLKCALLGDIFLSSHPISIKKKRTKQEDSVPMTLQKKRLSYKFLTI